MSFVKKTWLNIPDENNPPDIPEGQDALARFDADNMNRIEDGIKYNYEEVEKRLTIKSFEEHEDIKHTSSPLFLRESVCSHSLPSEYSGYSINRLLTRNKERVYYLCQAASSSYYVFELNLYSGIWTKFNEFKFTRTGIGGASSSSSREYIGATTIIDDDTLAYIWCMHESVSYKTRIKFWLLRRNQSDSEYLGEVYIEGSSSATSIIPVNLVYSNEHFYFSTYSERCVFKISYDDIQNRKYDGYAGNYMHPSVSNVSFIGDYTFKDCHSQFCDLRDGEVVIYNKKIVEDNDNNISVQEIPCGSTYAYDESTGLCLHYDGSGGPGYWGIYNWKTNEIVSAFYSPLNVHSTIETTFIIDGYLYKVVCGRWFRTRVT